MRNQRFKSICLAMCLSMVFSATGCEIKKVPETVDVKETETKTTIEESDSAQAIETEQGTETVQESDSAQVTEAEQGAETVQGADSPQASEAEQGMDSKQATETAQETAVEPFGEEMSVDAATEKKMNIFLSNFSEAGLFAYDKEHPDINSICYWVHIWMKINKGSTIEYESRPDQTYEKISLEQLNQVTEKYLGITIKDEEAALVKSEWYFYENGNFYSPAADGESYTGLSIVSKVEKLSDGRLKLYYNNYYQDIDAYLEGKDKNYSMTEEEASKNSDYEKSNSGYAIVRTEGSSYILEYFEVRN